MKNFPSGLPVTRLLVLGLLWISCSFSISANTLDEPIKDTASVTTAPSQKSPDELKKEKIEAEKQRVADEKALAKQLKEEEAQKKAELKAAAAAAKKEEAEKIAAEKIEKARIANAPKACRDDYLQCLDVTMLIKNYKGMKAARQDCEVRTADLAKFQVKFNSSSTFNTYYDSEYELEKIRKDGTIRLVESRAMFQNGFGAWQPNQVLCYYSLAKSRAIMVVPDN